MEYEDISEDISEKFQELSLEWVKTGNANYRMFKMCDLQWIPFILGPDKDCNSEFDINESRITCAKNGGPIAVMKGENVLLSGSSHLLKNHIGIFSACGLPIAKLPVILFVFK